MDIETTEIDDIPVTLVRDGAEGRSEAGGVVLCHHGLGSSTAAWLHELQRFARAGFTVVGVDAVGHGRRRDDGLERRLADPRTKDVAFIDVVRETSDEIPTLVDGLTRSGVLADARLGLFGVSMGGFVAYAAVAKEPRLVAVVSLLGSPEWWMRPSPDSPHRHEEGFGRVRLLSMTAGRDESVPGSYAAAFHARLAARFEDHAERLRHIDYPRSAHFMEEDDWNDAVRASCRWFHDHL